MKYTGRADELRLYLEKATDDRWLRSCSKDAKKAKKVMKGVKTVHIEPLMGGNEELEDGDSLDYVLKGMPPPVSGQIHVLAVKREDYPSSAEDLCTVDPQIQSKMWKSVVRVSSEDRCSGAALVVDRTATHLYLLTNLHLWVDNVFAGHLSADFTNETKLCRTLNPKLTTKSTAEVSVVPQVVVEQFLPNPMKLKEVLRFNLNSEVCWRSSANSDFAIFKVDVRTISQSIDLARCETSTVICPTMDVHVFGFAGALPDHPHAIISASATGWVGNKMFFVSTTSTTIALV